jgi:DNA replication protein DnaC
VELKDLIGRVMQDRQTERACARCPQLVKGPPGVLCATCFDANERDRHAKALAAVFAQVRRSLPLKYRDVDLCTDEGRARVIARTHAKVALPLVDEMVRAGRGAVLRGSSATGKTTLAAAMLLGHAQRVVLQASQDDEIGSGPFWDAAKTCVYVRATDVVHARIQNPAGRGEAPIILAARYAPAVIVDDLGVEPPPARERVLVEILMARADNNMPTMVTTSRSDAALYDFYGEGVARRLLEDPCYATIELGGAR